MTGNLFTISAPSGAGKTSLVKALYNQIDHIGVSVSHTTRARRDGEQNGVDYHFIDEAEFIRMVGEGAFLEHAQVFRHYYGTSWQAVKTLLKEGTDVILEIDWQGMLQVKHLHPASIAISILPPSLNALAARLAKRETDSSQEIDHRMAQAQQEMSHFSECDFVIINDDFDTALKELTAVILSARLKTERQACHHQQLISQLLMPH